MLCQKVFTIYHSLTFSDPSQVSQGPNKKGAPQSKAYQAAKVKTQKHEITIQLMTVSQKKKKTPSTSFMLKMYDFTSDSLTTECQKEQSVRLLCLGNAYQEAASHLSHLHP